MANKQLGVGLEIANSKLNSLLLHAHGQQHHPPMPSRLFIYLFPVVRDVGGAAACKGKGPVEEADGERLS